MAEEDNIDNKLTNPSKLKSFARRVGKNFTKSKQDFLDEYLKDNFLNKENIKNKQSDHVYNKIIMEIGFGMGEHIIYKAEQESENLFLGVEVYLNGVYNVARDATDKNINNILLYNNNIDFLLDDIVKFGLKKDGLDEIYVLFPDPWTKNSQKKKRLLNDQRIRELLALIKEGGCLYFASDIKGYFDQVVGLVKNIDEVDILNEDNYQLQFFNYTPTKYHKKAIREGRDIQFLHLQKNI